MSDVIFLPRCEICGARSGCSCYPEDSALHFDRYQFDPEMHGKDGREELRQLVDGDEAPGFEIRETLGVGYSRRGPRRRGAPPDWIMDDDILRQVAVRYYERVKEGQRNAPRWLACCYLYWRAGMTAREIADYLGTTVGTVEQALRRRKKVKPMFSVT